MATWKCDVRMKFGKYSAHVWKATERESAPIAGELGSAKVAIDKVLEAVQKAGYAEGDDEVIFRDTSYASLTELRQNMSRAPY